MKKKSCLCKRRNKKSDFRASWFSEAWLEVWVPTGVLELTVYMSTMGRLSCGSGGTCKAWSVCFAESCFLLRALEINYFRTHSEGTVRRSYRDVYCSACRLSCFPLSQVPHAPRLKECPKTLPLFSGNRLRERPKDCGTSFPRVLGPSAHTAPCGVQEGLAFDPAGT